jgi:WD40 repeat protein
MDSERLNRAIALAKQGKKQEARTMLSDLAMREPGNPQVWLWLADTMPTLPERIQVLKEGLANNPQNSALQKAVAALGGQSGPFQSQPPPKPPAAESGFSVGEFQSLSGWAQQEAAEPVEEEEEDWLRSLRTSTTPARTPARPEPREKPPVLTNFGMPESKERDPADWLSSLAGPHSEPASAPAPVSKTGSPQPTLPADRSEFLKPVTTAPKSKAPSPVAPETPPETAKISAVDTVRSALPKWLAPLKKEPKPEETGPVESDEYDIEEVAPPRRRWLGIILLVALGAVIIVAGIIGWPIIQETVWVPIAAAIAGPTPAPTQVPSPTLTPTVTPTPTPTVTPTPIPTQTSTPIPALSKVELVGPSNISQFRSVASVKARGKVGLETRLLAGLLAPTTVRIWDFATGNFQIDLEGPKAPIQQAAVSPDGKLAAAVSEEPAVWVWNIQSGAVVATLEFSKDLTSLYSDKTFPRTLQVQFSPDSKTVLASSLLGVSWWDLQTRQEKHLFPLLPAELKTFREEAVKPGIKSATSFLMSFAPDGKSLAVGSPYKVYILVWPGGGGRTTLTSKLPLFEMRWMENGLLGLLHPGLVAVWDTNLNRQVTTVPALKSQPSDLPPVVAFRADGKGMITATENSRGLVSGLKLVELPSGKVLQSFDPHTDNPVESPILSPDSKLLFGRSSGDLFIWDTTTGKELRRIANRKGFSAVSTDGKLYVEVGTTDTSLWGAPTGQ